MSLGIKRAIKKSCLLGRRSSCEEWKGNIMAVGQNMKKKISRSNIIFPIILVLLGRISRTSNLNHVEAHSVQISFFKFNFGIFFCRFSEEKYLFIFFRKVFYRQIYRRYSGKDRKKIWIKNKINNNNHIFFNVVLVNFFAG